MGKNRFFSILAASFTPVCRLWQPSRFMWDVCWIVLRLFRSLYTVFSSPHCTLFFRVFVNFIFSDFKTILFCHQFILLVSFNDSFIVNLWQILNFQRVSFTRTYIDERIQFRNIFLWKTRHLLLHELYFDFFRTFEDSIFSLSYWVIEGLEETEI